MRKIIFTIVTLSIVLSLCVCASATSFSNNFQKDSIAKASSNANATQRRGLVEYLELAINRLTLYAESKSYDSKACLNSFADFLPTELDNEYTIFSSVGLLDVSKVDNKINTAQIMCVNMKADSDAISKSFYSFIAALSALECDAMEDDTLELAYRFGLSSTKNALEEAQRIWRDEIYKKIQETINTAVKNEPILVYSGNYDYFLEYADYKDSLLTSITAKTR